MDKILLTALAIGSIAAGQTQVNLRTQSKTDDFSAFSSTKPFSAGATLPATCAVGQMLFLTTAAAGQNVYGCASTNTWTLQSGGAGSGGTVNIENAGTLVGSNSSLSFSGGTGIAYAISNIGSAISIQTNANTAVIPTIAAEQAGGARVCSPASGSATAYACSLSPTLTTYSAGMVLNFTPDVTEAGGPATLNVDFLGAVPVKLADGLTDPAPGDIIGGRMIQVWFDGSVFRLLNPAIPAGVLGDVLPVCSAAARGRLWYVDGAPGVKDTLLVCAKDGTGALAWRTLY